MDRRRDDAEPRVIHDRPIITDEGCGASDAAATWRPRLEIGMYIVGMDVGGVAGEEVGRVKEIRAGSFLVERMSGGSVVLPFERIDAIVGDRILLDVPAAEVDRAEMPRASFTRAPDPGDIR